MARSRSAQALFDAQASGPGVEADDPLGLGLQQRGMESWHEDQATRDPNFLSGPLPDPKWEGYLQALHERGVDRLTGGNAAPVGTQPASSQLVGVPLSPSLIALKQSLNTPKKLR